ncbi:MAG: formylglycine-generating enzyme family protein [Prevotellaceae bacterium]|jgi:formylglycine-generating enzyme required for sulfatase activity|nr:formylglycine-generating enzyme family protein [Prevotellaceae bacterium]
MEKKLEKKLEKKFYALSPTNQAANAADYYDALDWALLSKDAQDNLLHQDAQVRNIALTGPYGSGKSSILKTYEKKKEEEECKDLHFLYISLAQFCEYKEKTEKAGEPTPSSTDGKAFRDGENSLKDSKRKVDTEGNKEEKTTENATENETDIEKGSELQTGGGKGEVKEETKTTAETEPTADKEKKLRLIELSILQQLFYRESNETLPRSRFKKIDSAEKTISGWDIAVLIVCVLVLLLFSRFNATNINGFVTSIEGALNLDSCAMMWCRIIVLSIAFMIVLVAVWRLVAKVMKIISKVKIGRFNFKHMGIEGGIELDSENMSKSILNKYLDEILYFFEVTEYNVVVIEDLDRFHNTEIFSKLRELNSLINEYEKVKAKKPNVVFIYALCDEFFQGKERTKFFDFIIPVMPVVSANNSDEKLEEALLGSTPQKTEKPKVTSMEDSEESLKKLIKDLSLYIDDMRLLHNVINEYQIYRNLITKEGLISSKLLAVILYKNLYPDDFGDLLRDKGILYKAIMKYAESKAQKKDITMNDIYTAEPDSAEEWQRSLIFSLLQNKYIDEDYSDYIHGGDLSKNDKLFLSHISNKAFPIKGFEHPLNNIAVLMERIPEEEFTKEYILNYRLVDYLLALATANRFSEQRESIFILMSNQSKDSIDFVNGFIERERSDLRRFYEEIKKHWNGNILEDSTIKEYNRDKLLAVVGTVDEKKKRQEEYKERLKQQGQDIVFEDSELKSLEMVFVKGGTFRMGSTEEQGSDAYDHEKPVHEVTLSDFSIGKYAVTQAQWAKIMGNNPSYNAQGRNYPVERVSWDDAQEFCKRLNMLTGKSYRLPTEAEWEYAARGGNVNKGYKYSGSNNLNEAGWYNKNSDVTTHPVGQKTSNELGIYDMSGNVWEWCSDWYGEYPAIPQTDPSGSSWGSYRVLRGGCWDSSARNCRSAYRNRHGPGSHDYRYGFRVVASAPL